MTAGSEWLEEERQKREARERLLVRRETMVALWVATSMSRGRFIPGGLHTDDTKILFAMADDVIRIGEATLK